jgi:hypothetical protein
MRISGLGVFGMVAAFGLGLPGLGQAQFSHVPSVDGTYARDLKQPVDEAYTAKIRQYTTKPEFSSPLVDYLPASKTVPTPEKTLGVIAGAPDVLPYAEDVY